MRDKGVKILVVDDEPDVLEVMQDIFSKKGFTVFAALESDTALAIFDRERPKICIIDVHMPKSTLDGIALLERIRQESESIYSIMLTRITDKEKIDAAKELKANHYVLKPIDFPELLALIQEG